MQSRGFAIALCLVCLCVLIAMGNETQSSEGQLDDQADISTTASEDQLGEPMEVIDVEPDDQADISTTASEG
jgi:hypothetical protein